MFVEKLNKNDLDKIFNSVGLEVDYNNTEGMRYPIDPLGKGILVRCVDKKQSQMVDGVLEYMRGVREREEARMGIKLPKGGRYSYIELSKYKMWVLEDFWAYPMEAFNIDEEEHSLFLGAYINYMCEKFPEYQAHLDMYIDTIRQEEGYGPND